jgi:hypothetical protein
LWLALPHQRPTKHDQKNNIPEQKTSTIADEHSLLFPVHLNGQCTHKLSVLAHLVAYNWFAIHVVNIFRMLEICVAMTSTYDINITCTSNKFLIVNLIIA